MSQDTKVKTGVVRFSYLTVFEPRSMADGEDAFYSTAILIDKKDKATIAAVTNAVKAAAEEGKTSKFGGKVPANLKTPLRDGDEERPDEAGYAGHFFLTAKSKRKIGLIDINRREIIDPDDFKSGDYGKAIIRFYPFAVSGNKGVACALENLLKLKDGEPLGSASEKAEDAFAEDFSDDNADEYEL